MPSRPRSRRILFLIAAAAALLVFFLSGSRLLSEQERKQRAIAALIALQNSLAGRHSLRVRLSADYTPTMAEHQGGDWYRVESYVGA